MPSFVTDPKKFGRQDKLAYATTDSYDLISAVTARSADDQVSVRFK
jgi:hypothetical protein